MIETVFIQVERGDKFPNTALYKAAQGFEFIGHPVTTATAKELGALIPRPEDLVFGGVEVVRPWLAKLGVEPEPFDYPEPLLPFLGRDYRRSTLREIRKQYNEPGEPVFIKPVEHKEFTGHVIRRFGDLIRTQHCEPDTAIYVVEHVEFVSEWRFYVEHRQIIGVDHYKGDPLRFPDPAKVLKAARNWENAPAAYTLDFGKQRGGRTGLVEVNDMISAGAYGLEDPIYARLIKTRWLELVEKLIQ